MNTTITQAKLLCLDDDAAIAELVTSIASKAGFDSEVALSAQEFFEKLGPFDPDIITLDMQVPDMDGIEVLRKLATSNVGCGLFLITGMDARTIASAEYYAATLGLRVISAIQKPFLPEDLLLQLISAKSSHEPLGVDDFASAIEKNQLLVHYQPVARRTDGFWRIDSVEALLRWLHPSRGTLMPTSFLQLSEDEVLSRTMTDFVIQEGLERLKGWHASAQQLSLRVNLSASLITDLEFPDRLERALIAHEITPESLTIEVNETAMLAEHPETIDILTRLRLKNIGLAIDDFGIGYSSLTQLFRMPFSEMKIDRSLIDRAAESSEGRIAVEALIDLAHKLDLSVCAEGVESQEALAVLSDSSCDAVQGFFVSPPLPASEIASASHRWHESPASACQSDSDRPGIQNTDRAASQG